MPGGTDARFGVLRRCPQTPLLAGLRVRVTDVDRIPFAGPRSAMVEVETPAGHRVWVMLADIALDAPPSASSS